MVSDMKLHVWGAPLIEAMTYNTPHDNVLVKHRGYGQSTKLINLLDYIAL